MNEKLAQLHLQKQEQTLREKLGVKNGAGKMPTIEASATSLFWMHESHRRSR